MVEKVPEFSAESLCLRQGMATSGRWCHTSCDTSWRMTAGISRPVSLFSPGLPWWILMASSILPLDTWSSLSNIFASFRLHLWPVLSRCSPTTVLEYLPAVCSLYLVPRLLLISPMYILSQLSHFSWYTV